MSVRFFVEQNNKLFIIFGDVAFNVSEWFEKNGKSWVIIDSEVSIKDISQIMANDKKDYRIATYKITFPLKKKK